jgi:uncharacterized protein
VARDAHDTLCETPGRETPECETPDALASPCVGVCRLDPRTQLCIGCLRNGSEIAIWRDADDRQRRAILKRIEHRRAKSTPHA